MASEASFEVLQDPNLKEIKPEDWTEQQIFIKDIQARINEIHNSVNDMRKIKKQVMNYNEIYKDKPQYKELQESGKSLIDKIDIWEAQAVQTKQSNFQDVINFPSMLNAQYFELKGFVDQHDPRVPKSAKDRLSDVDKQWGDYKEHLKATIGKDIEQYNELYKKSNVPALIMNERVIKP